MPIGLHRNSLHITFLPQSLKGITLTEQAMSWCYLWYQPTTWECLGSLFYNTVSKTKKDHPIARTVPNITNVNISFITNLLFITKFSLNNIYCIYRLKARLSFLNPPRRPLTYHLPSQLNASPRTSEVLWGSQRFVNRFDSVTYSSDTASLTLSE